MEENSRSRKAYTQMRAGMHIGMGILYIIIGILLLYVKYFGAIELSPVLAYSLGTLMFCYGIFRIWRGFKDMRAKG
jgi:uncharacterized membrane protein HdeD (DUF308 family)